MEQLLNKYRPLKINKYSRIFGGLTIKGKFNFDEGTKNYKFQQRR